MKRLILLVMLLTGFQHCFAQHTGWTFGVKAGLGKSGSGSTEVRDAEIRDEYKRGNNFSVGLRAGYRFLRYFTVTADAEWQQIQDERVRIVSFNAQEIGRVVNTIRYENRFQRVQVPVALQFSPFTKGIKPYAKLGVMPSYIYNGSFDYTFRSSVTATTTHQELDANFDLYPNRKLDWRTDFFAGIGVDIGKHLSIEAVRYFAGRMDYVTDYNPAIMVLYPTYYSYALRGTQLSVTYHIH